MHSLAEIKIFKTKYHLDEKTIVKFD